MNTWFPGYKMKTVDGEHLQEMFTGRYAPLFWSVQIFGMILPIIILLFQKRKKAGAMLIVAILVVVGAWFKRFLIVVPTQLHPFIPIQEFRNPGTVTYLPGKNGQLHPHLLQEHS
jgi:molybdopterin-containing oxidoreductase family membrane subunit